MGSKVFLQSIILLFTVLIVNALMAQDNRQCHRADNWYNSQLYEELEKSIQKRLSTTEDFALERGNIVIPVVVHIVYQNELGNLSDNRVHSQIAALNRDFNRLNDNLVMVPDAFQDRIAQVGFEFCLATRDPDGNPTSGIIRRATSPNFVYDGSSPWIFYTNLGGQDAWDTEQYLNIWVTRISEFIVGFGTFPGESPPNEQGVIVAPESFGIYDAPNAPFNLGRTVTHEVGHYFNLIHPWGNLASCDNDDLIADTPEQSVQHFGCPSTTSATCGSTDLTTNFMNYGNDACIAMFTQGQARRMQATLLLARGGLLDSKGCNSISTNPSNESIRVYPNPANYFFCIEPNSVSQSNIPFRMIDIQGRIILEDELITGEVRHFRATQNGLYFLQFTNGDELITKKLVINRR